MIATNRVATAKQFFLKIRSWNVHRLLEFDKLVPRFIETTEGWVFICSWFTGETDVFRKHNESREKNKQEKDNLEEKDNASNRRKLPRKSAIINIF